MQYFCIKSCYFCCFGKCDFINVFCCGNYVWIGGVDVWDVGLDINMRCV